MGTVSRFWDEAMLVAYVDGELDAATARRLEAAIAEDAEAQAQVRLLRASAAAARGAYAELLTEPVPEGLRATVLAGARRGKVVPLRRHEPAPERGRLARALLPMAASLLLVALGFAGGIYSSRSDESGLRLASGGGADAPFETALGRALDAPALGQAQDYADTAGSLAGSVTVTREFAAGFGALCREFRHEIDRMGKKTSENGIACRRADGGWEVLTLADPKSG